MQIRLLRSHRRWIPGKMSKEQRSYGHFTKQDHSFHCGSTSNASVPSKWVRCGYTSLIWVFLPACRTVPQIYFSVHKLQSYSHCTPEPEWDQTGLHSNYTGKTQGLISLSLLQKKSWTLFLPHYYGFLEIIFQSTPEVSSNLVLVTGFTALFFSHSTLAEFFTSWTSNFLLGNAKALCCLHWGVVLCSEQEISKAKLLVGHCSPLLSARGLSIMFLNCFLRYTTKNIKVLSMC